MANEVHRELRQVSASEIFSLRRCNSEYCCAMLEAERFLGFRFCFLGFGGLVMVYRYTLFMGSPSLRWPNRSKLCAIDIVAFLFPPDYWSQPTLFWFDNGRVTASNQCTVEMFINMDPRGSGDAVASGKMAMINDLQS